ncbi:MAG: methyltransferase family protein [Candidatus Hodarchaeota archaeon]
MKSSPFSSIIRLIGLTIILLIWKWFIDQHFELMIELAIIIGGVIAVVPISILGRFFLNKYPLVEYTFWTNLTIHFSIMIVLGVSIIRAILTYENWRGVIIPFPSYLSLPFLITSGFFVLITTFYLALRGLGAPFALIANSKYLVSDWLYARTRNPMVLAIISFLLSLGLFFQSSLFIIWVLTLVLPVWIFFLKHYEEKELEIRFGNTYCEYKARTPILLPLNTKLQKSRRKLR